MLSYGKKRKIKLQGLKSAGILFVSQGKRGQFSDWSLCDEKSLGSLYSYSIRVSSLDQGICVKGQKSVVCSFAQ